MGISKTRGTPKSSILIGFSTINHPFSGIPIFGHTHILGYIPSFPAKLKRQPVIPSIIVLEGEAWWAKDYESPLDLKGENMMKQHETTLVTSEGCGDIGWHLG